MASPELSRRVEKLVGYPPLSEMGADQRRELHEALLEAGSFDDLPGKWRSAMVGDGKRFSLPPALGLLDCPLPVRCHLPFQVVALPL